MRFGFSLAATGLIGIAVLAISFMLAILVRRLLARRNDAQTIQLHRHRPSDVEQKKAHIGGTTKDAVRSAIDSKMPAGSTAGPKTRKLSQLLGQLEQLFLDLDMQRYAKKIRQSNVEIRNSDYHGVRRFLGAFQGYGRLDGVLGDDLGNEKLDSLLDEAYSLAKSIESEQ